MGVMPTWESGSVLERDRVGFDSPYLHLPPPSIRGGLQAVTVSAAGSIPDGGDGFISQTGSKKSRIPEAKLLPVIEPQVFCPNRLKALQHERRGELSPTELIADVRFRLGDPNIRKLFNKLRIGHPAPLQFGFQQAFRSGLPISFRWGHAIILSTNIII